MRNLIRSQVATEMSDEEAESAEVGTRNISSEDTIYEQGGLHQRDELVSSSKHPPQIERLLIVLLVSSSHC